MNVTTLIHRLSKLDPLADVVAVYGEDGIVSEDLEIVSVYASGPEVAIDLQPKKAPC